MQRGAHLKAFWQPSNPNASLSVMLSMNCASGAGVFQFDIPFKKAQPRERYDQILTPDSKVNVHSWVNFFFFKHDMNMLSEHFRRSTRLPAQLNWISMTPQQFHQNFHRSQKNQVQSWSLNHLFSINTLYARLLFYSLCPGSSLSSSV